MEFATRGGYDKVIKDAHLSVAPGAAGGLAVVAGDDGGVAGAGEAARPRDLVAAHLGGHLHMTSAPRDRRVVIQNLTKGREVA